MACAVDTNSPQMEVGCPARTVMRTTAIGFGSLTKGHQMRSPRRYAGLFVEDYGCMVGDENQVTFVPESCGSGRISTNFDPAGTSNPVTTTPTMVTAAPTVSMSNAPTQAPSHFGSPAFVSEQCLNESMSLLSDPSVANQVLQVNQRVDAINCVPMTTVPPNTFSECNGDFATLQTAFVNACTGAGGNTASLDITMRCEFANGDANTYEINDYPLCFAPICGTPSPLCSGSAEVCDAPNIRPALDGLFLASLERRISGGAECIVNRALGGFLTTATAAPSPSNAPFAATQAPVSTSPTMTSMMPVPASQEPSMLPTSAPVLPPTPPPVATPTSAPILATTAPVAATPAPVPISSQQVCSTQTQTLNNSPALADIDLPPSSALFDDENCDFSSGLIVCMLDYGPFSNNVESACASVGGQFFSSSTSLTCTVVGQSGQGFEYILRDFPSCIGIACDVNQFLLASADDFTTTKEQIEAPGGLVCDDPIVTLGVGGGGSGGGSGAGVASLHLALVFASFGLTFLWF